VVHNEGRAELRGERRQTARALAEAVARQQERTSTAKHGEAAVKVFLDACIVAIVLAVISWIVLSGVQEPVDRAFTTPPYTRVGD